MKTILRLSIAIFFIGQIHAQSKSVFAANYFTKNEEEPPLKAGKGFDITDVYKQTRFCFTPESAGQDKLKPPMTGSKTHISVHYTTDEKEFSLLKTKGASGKISYLNLFSLGGSKLENFSSNTYDRQERLVFIARVDFGLYTYDSDPVLSTESKSLIDNGKHDEFMQLYGTHFINGVRKESSVWITLTKKNYGYSSSTSDETSVNTGFKTPFKVGVNFEVNEGTKTDWVSESKDYDISIEINGPKIDRAGLENEISKALDSKETDKILGIRKIINKTLSNINNENEAVISQYYFAPFTLYGIDRKNINWDEQKENNLIKINEALINVYNKKSLVDKLILPTGLKEIEADFDGDLKEFSKKNEYKAKINKTYNILLPNLKQYKKQLDTTISSLGKYYARCADLKCSAAANCCSFSSMENSINNLTAKVDNDITKLATIKDAAWVDAMNEILTPECEKENISYLTVINKSANPYDFYDGDKFIETLKGGSQTTYKITLGTSYFTAKQQSGYLMYPTINKRTITVEKKCEEITIKVGFED